MQRRTFIKDTALCAIAVSASGFIRFDGNRYVSDCETTSDILGPYYRPNSPLRNSLILPGDTGNVVELRGVIKHNDCTTPYKNAKIELWHCSSKGIYDNTSGEYKYRGTTYCDANGKYSFKTVLPVPYDVGNGTIRPAHFHLMITAQGYQSLVTQLYFSGDVNISKDSFASSPNAKRRILNVQSLKDGTKRVSYDVSMSETLAAEPSAIDKLLGVYIDEKDESKRIELFKRDNMLWMKNEVYGHNFEYVDKNTFKCPGEPAGMEWTLKFEILPTGLIKLTQTYLDEKGHKEIVIALK